jgi:hypothetical protein
MVRLVKFRAIILPIAIAVAFIMFIVYGINTLYQQPELSTFCNESSYQRVPVSSCDKYLKETGLESNLDNCFCNSEGKECTAVNPKTLECGAKHKGAMDKYSLVVFIIMVSIGSVAIIVSFFISIQAVSYGLMGGGLLSVIIGSIRNWGNSENWMKFVIFGIILVVLIWFGSRRFGDDESSPPRSRRHRDYEE